MTTIEKAVELASRVQLELIRQGKISTELASEEVKLVEETRNMERVSSEALSERECIGALYLICLLSDYYDEDMTSQVVDDDEELLKKINGRSDAYFSVAYGVCENESSVFEFHVALQQDRSIV